MQMRTGSQLLEGRALRRTNQSTRAGCGGPRLFAFALGGIILLPQVALANQDQEALPRVTVIGTRVPLTVGQEAASLTVLTREQIERSGPATGADLMRQVPGVQVDQLGGPGGISLVYIHGSDPNHVLVLVDGVRMNVSTNSRGGGFDLSDLDPSQIERIEVLRGAASAIYGADAMGGVVNIVTRKGDRGGAASATIGGIGYRTFNARATWQVGEAALLSASAASLRDGRESQGGHLSLKQAALAARITTSAGARMEVDFRRIERESTSFPDDSGGVEYAEIRALERRESRSNTLSARGVADVGRWTVMLEGTAFDHWQRAASPGVAPGVRSDFGLPASLSDTQYLRGAVLLNAVRHLEGGNELAVGAEYQQERGASNTVYQLFGTSIPADFDLRRRTRSAFSELKWFASSDLILRAGVRYDAIHGSGSHTSPSIGARYSFSRLGGHLIANYAAGFKPPSFFALGLPPPLGGNPELKAEHSKGGLIGYEQRLGRSGEASVTAFRRRYSDLVTFANATNQLVNADRVDVKGAEVAFYFQASEVLGVKANYTRLISRVSPNGEPLRQRPGHRSGVQLHLKPQQRASIVWSLEYAAGLFDSSIPTGNVFLGSYVRNDLAFTYALGEQIKLTGAIDNLADRENLWYVGAPSLGRRARVGASISF